MAAKMTAARRAGEPVKAAVLQAIGEICDEKGGRRKPAFWRDDDIPGRVMGILGWKRSSERRLRMISGTISGLISAGSVEAGEAPKGNRPLWLN